MTNTETIYNILARHHEMTAGAIFKKCAGIKSIGNQKTVSNALTRLKQEGRVASVYDDIGGLWLWHVVRGSPVASSDCAMSIGDAAAMANKTGTADHSEHDLEIASDVAEIERPNVQKNLTVADADMVATLNALDTERESQERQAVAETVTPEPTVSVEVKAADKAPMSVQEVVDNYPLNFLDPNMFFAYCAGISKAERHHGISQ